MRQLAAMLGIWIFWTIIGSGCGAISDEPMWQLVLDEMDLDGAILSVGGTGPNDVFAVGGPLGNAGFESLAVHWNGQSWHSLEPGGNQTYWWVAGSGPTDMWLVGTIGRISHWDGKKLTEHSSGTKATLWGAWAASESDAWAVGGTPGGGASAPEGNDVVLRWNGERWTQVVLPGQPRGASLYKVWGTASTNLFVVGEGGTIWHRMGENWRLESDSSLTTDSLLTVSGCGTDTYAVGNNSVLWHNGSAWSRLGVTVTSFVNGVACDAAGEVLLVGTGGLKVRRVHGEWRDELVQLPAIDLHAAWNDGAGAFWVGGGDFFSRPTANKRRRGALGRFGKGVLADFLSP